MVIRSVQESYHDSLIFKKISLREISFIIEYLSYIRGILIFKNKNLIKNNPLIQEIRV